MRLQILSFSLSFLSAFAANGAVDPKTVPIFQLKVEQKHVTLVAPPGHHFNVKAPMSVQADGVELPLTAEERQIHAPLVKKAQGIVASAYLCDEAKTFCIRQEQSWGTVASTAMPAQKISARSAPHEDPETGFIVNDPDKAFALAGQKKLPLLIDFFGIWCPPCNHLEAMVLKNPHFKKSTVDRFVRLQLDNDLPGSRALNARYKVKGLPTLIFATSDGQEITRIEGFRPLDEILKSATLAFAHKEKGYEKLAASSDLDDQYQAATIALDREDWTQATLLLKTVEKDLKGPRDPRRESILKLRLALAKNQGHEATEGKSILEDWIVHFPRSNEVLNNLQSLAELEASAGNKNKEQTLLKSILQKIAELRKNPALLKSMDYSSGDLYQLSAESYAKLGDKENATRAYLACAQANADDARAEKSAYARGPKLEEAYCLAKAGQSKEAESLLRQGVALYPTEYTFRYQLARLLLEDFAQPASALSEAQHALEFAYGVQRIRSSLLLASIYAKLGKKKDALLTLDAELKALPREINAHESKARKKLEAKKAELEKSA